MRIHTSVDAAQIRESLRAAEALNGVPAHVYIDRLATCGSRSHDHAFDVHLGADEKMTGEKRRPPNSGSYGASDDGRFARWAATYDEWGWFLAQVFEADPDAKAGPYGSRRDFHLKTKGAYLMVGAAS